MSLHQVEREDWRDEVLTPPQGHNRGSRLDPGPDRAWRFDIVAFRIDEDAIISSYSVAAFERAIQEQGDKKTRLLAIDQAHWRWRQGLTGQKLKLYSAISDLAKMPMGVKEPRAALLSIARIGVICGVNDPSDAAKAVAALETLGAIVALRWTHGKKHRGYFSPVVTADDRMGLTSHHILAASKGVDDEVRKSEAERKRRQRENAVPGNFPGTTSSNVPGELPKLSRGISLDTPTLSQEICLGCPGENPHLVSSLLVATKDLVSPKDGGDTANSPARLDLVTVSVPRTISDAESGDQLPLSDTPDASGITKQACARLSVAAADTALIIKVGGTVKRAVDRWSDAAPDARGCRFGHKAFGPYFWERWFFNLDEDIRKMRAEREANDRLIAAKLANGQLSLPAPDDGQGAWTYPPGKARWIDGLKRHVEVETLNNWLAEADRSHGAKIARMRDCEAVLHSATPHDDLPDLILWAALERVYRYDGGAAPVDPSVVDRISGKHPHVPRRFVVEHVTNCYANPPSVGMQRRSFNGQPWLRQLAEATFDSFGLVLDHAAKERRAKLSEQSARMVFAFTSVGTNRLSLNDALNAIVEPKWQMALQHRDLSNPFADLSDLAEAVFDDARKAILTMLDDLLERGFEAEHPHVRKFNERQCGDAIVHVRAATFNLGIGGPNAVPVQVIKPKPARPGEASIDSGPWED